ncbi:F-box protein SKIP2-like [Rutidosis leptorrhynchoides]|uniref:F-box protein SKIP2-like n=1 Tax=Rutidosis leptorrhynchoides TaxID=125765 RepID=UPI003A99BCA1
MIQQPSSTAGVLMADISDLPDACLAYVFKFLGPTDRKQCSLVSHRWLEIEGQNRHRLSLNAQSNLITFVPSMFTRFDAVTKLSLKCDRRSLSINDESFVSISIRCVNLVRLKLRSCREITVLGMECFASNCSKLKKISIGSCSFGGNGINAVVQNCRFLEELSIKRLRGDSTEMVRSGVVCSSLKMISLKEMCNGQCFGPLISGSKNLKSFRVSRCSGDWDRILEIVANNAKGLVEMHLERLQVSDFGLELVSGCRNLEVLHLLKTPDCSNLGLVSIAERCSLLRKVHIDGWRTNRIDDLGLISVAKYCPNLQELVLISVSITCASLERLGTNCRKLERLALCGIEMIGDVEISCIAAKFSALRKLCIKSCPVSDHGIMVLAVGCPNLVKVKVRKCKGVSSDGVGLLQASRESLIVSLDAIVIENGYQNGSGCNDIVETNDNVGEVANAGGTSRQSMLLKARLGLVSGRCLFRRWLSFNSGSRNR